MIKTIGSIFLLGLSFGLGPCVASCGPVLVSYIAGTGKNIYKGFLVYVLFSLSRVISYIILALAVFYLGRFAEQRLFTAVLYKSLLILGGLFIAIVGVLMSLGKKIELAPFKFLYRHLLERDKKSILGLGFIIGLLPCGPLVAVLSYLGLVSKSWPQSIAYSVAFGLGRLFLRCFF